MIVPATRKYVHPYRALTFKIGETFSIDSGLGGSFIVAFRGWNEDRSAASFVVENPQSSFHGQAYLIPTSDIPKRLYILVPENPNFT